MSWNFDISQAPKGFPVATPRKTKTGETILVETHHHVRIIAAGNKGIVTLSKWLPDEERWEMFTKDAPPLAWMPWPEHPHAIPAPVINATARAV